MNKMLYKDESERLKVTNVHGAVYMVKPKGDNGNVRRSIDLWPSNKQALQQGSQGFPVHHLLLKLI